MMEQRTQDVGQSDLEASSGGINRRQMFAYTAAGPVLSVALGLGVEEAQAQALPTLPNIPSPLGLLTSPLPLTPPDITDYFDVADSINKPSQLTMALVRVDILPDNKFKMFLPRLDQGCGINTAVAIMLADHLAIDLKQVDVVLEDARNELGPNQITGGSANVRAFHEGLPIIVGVINAKMLAAAALALGVPTSSLRILPGAQVAGPGGARLSFGQLSARAAKISNRGLRFTPQRTPLADKPLAAQANTIVPRLESRDIVTGGKRFTLDQRQKDWQSSPTFTSGENMGKGALDIAKPAVVRMAPRINMAFKALSFGGKTYASGKELVAALKSQFPGLIDIVPPPPPKLSVMGVSAPAPLDSNAVIVPYPPAVAVIAETFGEAWDVAARLDNTMWQGEGSLLKNDSNQAIDAKLDEKLQTVPPIAKALAEKTISGVFTYPPAVAASLEVECAIVDAGIVQPGRLEIWAGLQSPQATVNAVALDLGMSPLSAVAHVIPSGGSFGRRLFWDPVQVAAYASKVSGRVVKLMYHRSDDVRHTRGRPQQRHRINAHISGGRVIAYEHLASSPRLDTRHGYGDFSTMLAVSPPLGITQNGPAHLAVEQFFFKTMVASPYNWGLQSKELLPADVIMNTVSYRSVHIQPFRSTEEMLVDEIAAELRSDPYSFRMKYLRQDRAKAVLKHVYEASGWARYNHIGNRNLGRALGLAVHQEAKSFTAAVVEIDTSDKTKGVLGRGAKVLRAWIAIDVGKPINESGLKAQFEGGLAESISLVLDAGLTFENGLPKEFSYNNYRIARMNNFPKFVDIHVMPANPNAEIGGAGEVGMSATSGAIGNAWRRATRQNPRNFPLNGLTDYAASGASSLAAGELPDPAHKKKTA